MILKNAKVNQEFLMEGITPNGKTKWSRAKLISNDDNKFVVLSHGITVVVTLPAPLGACSVQLRLFG